MIDLIPGPPMAGSSTSSASPQWEMEIRQKKRPQWPHSNHTKSFFEEFGNLRNVFPLQKHLQNAFSKS